MRDSFSRSKKKLKHLLIGRKDKSSGTGTETGGDRVGPAAGSLLSPVSHVVAGGIHNPEDDRVRTDGRQGSTVRLPHQDESELVPARGNETDQEEEANVDRRGVDQRYSHPDSDVEAAVGSRPSQEGDYADEVRVGRVRPSPSTTSFPHGRKPDGMWMWLFRLLPYLTPSLRLCGYLRRS